MAAARLAARVNILPEIRSIYRWRSQIRDEAQTLPRRTRTTR
jgi:uncharacterized protein involved in tolerance to divalent cations